VHAQVYGNGGGNVCQNNRSKYGKRKIFTNSGCPPFGEGEMQGLSRPFFSKFKDQELGKIFENWKDLP
jgi:hypothetical protein